MRFILSLIFISTSLFAISIFEDKKNSLIIEDIIKQPESFKKVNRYTFGVKNSTFWIRLNISNDSSKQQIKYIRFHYSLLENVDMYYYDNNILIDIVDLSFTEEKSAN